MNIIKYWRIRIFSIPTNKPVYVEYKNDKLIHWYNNRIAAWDATNKATELGYQQAISANVGGCIHYVCFSK